MRKLTIVEILRGAVAYELNCSEECLKKYTKAQLLEMLESKENGVCVD